MNKPIGAIITAAGMSSRMQAFKPLLPFGKDATGKEVTIIERIICSLRSAGIDEIICVTGKNAELLNPILKALGVGIVHNERFSQSSMYDSVALALREIADKWSGFLLMPVDMPLIRSQSISAIAKKAFKNFDVLIPVFLGAEGHPPLVMSCAFERVLSHDGHDGLRGAFTGLGIKLLPLPDEGILCDNDQIIDYEYSLKKLERYDYPSEREIEAIWGYFCTPYNIVRHQIAVSKLALETAEKLNSRGFNLDLELVKCGALLHDIAKGNSHHAQTGAQWITDIGYNNIARIIDQHSNMNRSMIDKFDETSIVCWADIQYKGECKVDIDLAFDMKLKKYVDDISSVEAITLKRKSAYELDKFIRENFK